MEGRVEPRGKEGGKRVGEGEGGEGEEEEFEKIKKKGGLWKGRKKEEREKVRIT